MRSLRKRARSRGDSVLERLPEDLDAARVRAVDASEQVQQRRLADPRRPHHRREDPLRELEATGPRRPSPARPRRCRSSRGRLARIASIVRVSLSLIATAGSPRPGARRAAARAGSTAAARAVARAKAATTATSPGCTANGTWESRYTSAGSGTSRKRSSASESPTPKSRPAAVPSTADHRAERQVDSLERARRGAQSVKTPRSRFFSTTVKRDVRDDVRAPRRG